MQDFEEYRVRYCKSRTDTVIVSIWDDSIENWVDKWLVERGDRIAYAKLPEKAQFIYKVLTGEYE